jgi:hypothetical protein
MRVPWDFRWDYYHSHQPVGLRVWEYRSSGRTHRTPLVGNASCVEAPR